MDKESIVRPVVEEMDQNECCSNKRNLKKIVISVISIVLFCILNIIFICPYCVNCRDCLNDSGFFRTSTFIKL